MRKCNCKEWEEFAPILDGAITIASVHGYHNNFKSFRFCSWCGKKLEWSD
ncbi:unnamed protein product [marine sediment metagenome]|uniref:Uncharacterized protein n=1 Tax=marine sediment metagenome TaxID=412755 RepID=X1R2D0_9ZZZZ